MSSKYILQPDGSILKKELVTVTAEGNIPNLNSYKDNIDLISKEINDRESNYSKSYKQANEEATPFSALRDRADIGLDENNEIRNKNLFNFTTSNENFNFDFEGQRINLEDIKSFKNFNSFTDNFEEIGMFANELELLGAHPGLGNLNKLYSTKWFFFLDYILEISGLIALIEVTTAIAELGYKGDDIVETNLLSLGNYTFSSNEFITPYFLKVLNYPTKLSNLNDRLASFFLGLNMFLSGDEIFKPSGKLAKSIKDLTRSGIQKGNLRIITAMLLYTVESQLQSGARDNLIDLLIRKFQMQKYWHDEQLYKAKSQGNIEKYSLEFKYYYFKFAIERIHVGLNVLRYEFLNLNYDVSVETPITRVGLSKSIDVKNIVLNAKTSKSSNQRYTWNSRSSWKPKSQSIRTRALPQALQLPVSFLANKLANKSIEDMKSENVALIGADKSLMQNFVINKTNRIDKSIVKLIETHLESEYVPFYFHDIRTNEIIAFHAFIDNLADSYSANYDNTKGFGRIDSVKNYTDTTRSIQLSFSMASTSPEDHDLMWYQINKLVSMCYPQWSDGFITNDKLGKYPFTQMPTASPLIRLRVGDLIKSNYSKQSLSRLHGIGDRNGIDDFIQDAIFNKTSIGEALKKLIKKYNLELSKVIELKENKKDEIKQSIREYQILIDDTDNILNDLYLEAIKDITNIDKNIHDLREELHNARMNAISMENPYELTKLEQQINHAFYNKDDFNPEEWDKANIDNPDRYPDKDFIGPPKPYTSPTQSKLNYSQASGNEPITKSGLKSLSDVQFAELKSAQMEVEALEIELEGAIEDTAHEKFRRAFELKEDRKTVKQKEIRLKSDQTVDKMELAKVNQEITELSGKFVGGIKSTKNSIFLYLSPGMYSTESGGFLSSLGFSDKSYIKVYYETRVELIEDKNTYCIVEYKDSNKKSYKISADKLKLRPVNPAISFKNIGNEKTKNKIKEIEDLSGNIAIVKQNMIDDIKEIKSKIENLCVSLSENIMSSRDKQGNINNPFTAAFESAQGKGLAGVITNLNVGNLMESPWETTRVGSKAPMMIKIDISFEPIHDIPPGLDHDGMMRAPTYNIGRLMNSLFDDVYDE